MYWPLVDTARRYLERVFVFAKLVLLELIPLAAPLDIIPLAEAFSICLKLFVMGLASVEQLNPLCSSCGSRLLEIR